MKKAKYLIVGDRLKEKGEVLEVILNAVPIGQQSVYKVHCKTEKGEAITFVVDGSTKLEVLND